MLNYCCELNFVHVTICYFRIGRTTVCTNFGQEVFLFQKLAMASKESLLKDFPNDWIHWIEVELACERKVAKGTWYNAPVVLLAMLMWKVSYLLSLYVF